MCIKTDSFQPQKVLIYLQIYFLQKHNFIFYFHLKRANIYFLNK